MKIVTTIVKTTLLTLEVITVLVLVIVEKGKM